MHYAEKHPVDGFARDLAAGPPRLHNQRHQQCQYFGKWLIGPILLGQISSLSINIGCRR